MSLKTRKVTKWIMIGSVLTFLTLLTMFALFFTMVFTGGLAQTGNDYRDYGKIYELLYDRRTGMITFPEVLSEEMVDIHFSYSYQDTWDDPTVYLFLQGTYSPEAYAEEVARLENAQKVYSGTVCKLLRDEEGKYSHPAYIAIENHNNAYEYALLTGENQITYIYTSFYDREKIPFDAQYLPEDFMTDEGREFGSGYNIYVSRQGSHGIVYDNTR